MSTAALYARYSPRPEHTSESAEAQLDRCRAYCRLRGFEVVGEYADEEVSGAKPIDERGEGSRLAALLRARPPGARNVIIAKLDRGFRNVDDCRRHVLAWSRRKISLHIVDLGGNAIDVSTSMGLFLLTLMASVAELERGQVSERTRDAVRRKQSNGRLMTRPDRPPYGWATDFDGARNKRTGKPVNLTQEQNEQQVIAQILESHAKGATCRQIADLLNGIGSTCRGRRWNHQTIAKIIRRAQECHASLL
jgi:DNA invertase Pin-like site-specific DNA recombinase